MTAGAGVGDIDVPRHGAAAVGAVILAAGASTRMGSPKQILRFGGISLLRRAAQAALGAGCAPVIVVTGAHAEQSRGELVGIEAREMWNAHWEAGMASSIGAGLEALRDADENVGAVALMLCDQPLVTADIISALIVVRRVTSSPVVASSYAGGFGVPALFSRALFAELSRLDGGAGAKEVIERHRSEARFVSFPGGEVDVDSPADVARLRAMDGDDDLAAAAATIRAS